MPQLYKLADADYADQAPVLRRRPARRSATSYIGGAWKTILVGGLGRGGRGYYALDVTDPASPGRAVGVHGDSLAEQQHRL